MALSLGTLSAYTKQLVEPLLTSAVIGAKTQQMIMDGGIVIPKAKSVVAIPLMDTDAVFQADGCGYSPSGTTSFTQRSITVGKIQVSETICPKNFEAYFTQEALRQGSNYQDFGNTQFLDAYLAKKNARIAAQIETAIWQGDITGSGGANLNKFDGLQKQLDNGSPIDANVSGYTGVSGSPIATITVSNVVAATEGIYKAIPAEVMAKGDVKIFVGYDWYRLLILAYRALNLFSYNPQDVNAQSFILPGTNIEIVPVNGLNTTGDAYAMSVANMALAVDLENEENNYRVWYSEDNDEVRTKVSFKVGVNVAFTNECVKFKSGI
jgi:hypothetical protein